jgi:hypothetical protein
MTNYGKVIERKRCSHNLSIMPEYSRGAEKNWEEHKANHQVEIVFRDIPNNSSIATIRT